MPERVTIRILPDKERVYDEFKELVTKKLHSDVCYVVTELMETFTQAVNKAPNPNPITMHFLKQNIQINMGCTFHYNTKRARRLGPDKTQILTDLNHVLPEVIEQWPNLKPTAQAYWYNQLIKQGIINPNRDKCHTIDQQKTTKKTCRFRKLHQKLRGLFSHVRRKVF